jgi:hypothetical protein
MTTIEILNEEHDHPAFPQPSDRNALIWRYQDFDKFELLVTTGRLYMRRADLFNKDEFEGTTPQGEIDHWKQLANSAATPMERATIEHNRAEIAEYVEHFRKNYFVNCWNMAPDENVAMWERYTSSPESVVMRSQYGLYAKQFHHGVTHVGKVTYIDYSLSVLPGMNILHRITHKRHFFRDEQEVRAVVCSVCPAEVKAQLIDPHVMPDGCGYAPPINVVELIEAVTLHPDATPDFAAKVAMLCSEHGLPAPNASAMAATPVF